MSQRRIRRRERQIAQLRRKTANHTDNPALQEQMAVESTHEVMKLQRAVGNQAVQAMLAQHQIAQKPFAGLPPLPGVRKADTTIQRCGGDANCACNDQASGEAAVAEAGANIQRSFGQRLSRALNSSLGRGSRLDGATRANLEPTIGMNLSNVTLHTDEEADVLARSVDAEAFTTGNDIYFRNGRYDPHSESGLHLLAHEVAHTAQQHDGPVSGVQMFDGLSISEPNDPYEQAAEQTADDVVAAVRHGDMATHDRKPQGVRNNQSVVQRKSSGKNFFIQRKNFRDQSVQGWTVDFNPVAVATSDKLPQQKSGYDSDADNSKLHSVDFGVPNNDSGTIFLSVNMGWQRVAGGAAPGPGPKPNNGGSDFKNSTFCTIGAKIPGVGSVVKTICNFADPCDRAKAIDDLSNATICSIVAALAAAGGSVIPGLGTLLGGAGGFTGCMIAMFFGGDAIRDSLKELVGAKDLKDCGKGGKEKPPAQTTDKGKGSATMQLFYKVNADGIIEVFGPDPISQSNGTGARVVSPVQSSKVAAGGFANVSLDPMIHSEITKANANGETIPEVNDFQHSFRVNLKPPPPPAPLDVCCGDQVEPFVVGSDKLQSENSEIERLHKWWDGLNPVVKEQVEKGKLPITITGRASRTAGNALNLQLAEKRAAKVKRFMQDFAGSDAHIITFALGEEKAASTEPGQKDKEDAHERRADVKIDGKLDGKVASGVVGQVCSTNSNENAQKEVCENAPGGGNVTGPGEEAPVTATNNMAEVLQNMGKAFSEETANFEPQPIAEEETPTVGSLESIIEEANQAAESQAPETGASNLFENALPDMSDFNPEEAANTVGDNLMDGFSSQFEDDKLASIMSQVEGEKEDMFA